MGGGAAGFAFRHTVLTVIPGKVGRIQITDQSAIPFATRGTLWFANGAGGYIKYSQY